jgi:hypothetical protein
LKLASIGRETLVVVSVGGVIAAAALLPRVVGEPRGPRFALPSIPAARSANVTAPIFALPTPRVTEPRHHLVLGLGHVSLGLVISDASVSLTPSRNTPREQTPVVRTAHPSGTSPRTVRPQPQPVVPLSQPVSLTPAVAVAPPPQPVALTPAVAVAPPPQPVSLTPAVAVAPPQPASPAVAVAQPTPTPPPAVVAQPTLAPQPAPALTPTDLPPLAVAASARTTVSARQPANDPKQLGALTSTKHDWSNSSAQRDGNRADNQGQKSAAAPVADQRLGPTSPSGPTPAVPTVPSPQQPLSITVENSTSSPPAAADPSQGLPSTDNKRYRNDSSVQPTETVPPAPTAPGPPPAGPTAPQPPDLQQATPWSGPAPADTSLQRYDNNSSGSQRHGDRNATDSRNSRSTQTGR